MWTHIELQEDTCILHLKGRFITGSDADYLRVCKDLEPLTFARLLVDCGEVPYLDSTGINFMLGLWRTAAEAGRQFSLVRANGRVREVLRICHLETFFPILEQEPAMRAAASPAA